MSPYVILLRIILNAIAVIKLLFIIIKPSIINYVGIVVYSLHLLYI